MAIKVVLVDDHAVVREGLRALLVSQPGIEVVAEAGDGREAVRVVGQMKPDVVVMDVAMPGMYGIEATRLIREGCPDTRVVILSMHAQAEYVFRALQAGASGYLVKESASAEVADAIRAVAVGRRFLSESISELVLEDYVRRGETPTEDPLMRLSSREREVLQLIVEGRSNTEIAEVAALSPKTVETYRSRLMKKLDITNLPELVKFAIQHGLTTVDR